MARRFAALVLLLLARAAAADSPLPVGPEFQVNTHTQYDQERPAVAMDDDGGFVVVWEDADSTDVVARRYDASGAPLVDEFPVNTTLFGTHDLPAVAMEPEGSFVVVWRGYCEESGREVCGQRYDSNGSPIAIEFRVNTDPLGTQSYPAVAANEAGEFVVVWQSYYQDGSQWGVFGRNFGTDGTPAGDQFQINETTLRDQWHPSVAVDTSGGFVVVWQGEDEEGYGVFARRYSSIGEAVGSEFPVNASPEGSQTDPVVATQPGGSFVVVWDDHRYALGDVIVARRFGSDGGPLGDEFEVNSFVFASQEEPTLATGTGGGFVVVWESQVQDGSTYGVFGQAFDHEGLRVGGEFQVNTETYGRQYGPAVAANERGEFVVAWSSDEQDGYGDGVFAQRFVPEPAPSILEVAALTTLGLLAAGARRVR